MKESKKSNGTTPGVASAPYAIIAATFYFALDQKGRYQKGEEIIAQDDWFRFVYVKHVIVPIASNPDFDPATLPESMQQQLIAIMNGAGYGDKP